MILKYGNLDIEMRFEQVSTLVVENQTLFVEMSNDAFRQQEGGDGKFILMDDNKNLKSFKNNLSFLTSPFNLEQLNRKIETNIKKKIEKDILDTESDAFLQIEKEWLRIIHNVTLNYQFAIDIPSIMSVKDFLKNTDVCVSEWTESSIAEHIMEYVHFIMGVEDKYGIICLNFRDFMTPDDVEGFIRDCALHRYNIVFLETRKPRYLSKYEEVYLIDKDLCEIY